MIRTVASELNDELQDINNKKKKFSYYQQFRFIIYMLTGFFILKFTTFVFVSPKREAKIEDYEAGGNKAVLFIGFLSGFVFNPMFHFM
jgi:hypothetical protein